MTAAEIAKILGVSRSTVTRVVNNYPVAEKTRKKVLEAIEEYGYVPNSSARSLRGKKPKEIGCFIVGDSIASSIYTGELITKVVDIAEERGYSVVISIIKKGQHDKIKRLLNTDSIRGAIIFGGTSKERKILDLIDKKYRIVIYDQMSINSSLSGYSAIINPDNFKGGYLAAEYLIKNGHKNIIALSGYSEKLPGVERVNGYKKALQDYGIKLKKSNILKTTTVREKHLGKLLIDYIEVNGKPDAIFAVTDIEALEAMKILKSLGYKIPRDISIIGFDGIYLTQVVEPRLTTVKVDFMEIARVNVESLIEIIESETEKNIRKIIDVSLLEGDSVKKLK